MGRDLGQMGEDVFRLWCSNVGLTTNPSIQDSSGWDFIVEFPIESSNNKALDLTPSPLECKVQVKATDKQDRKLSIKLSNITRLVKYNGPAFICFLEFDEQSLPTKSFLKEVDNELIERTLVKLRKMDSKGISDIHKRTITVKYSENDEFKSGGGGLLSRFQKVIGCDLDRYIRKKKEFIDSVGYESTQATFTIDSKSPIEDIVDFSIGIKPILKVDNFKVDDIRFGIKSKHPKLFAESGHLILQREGSTKAVASFGWAAIGEYVNFDVEMLTPEPLLQSISIDYIKFRFVSSVIEGVFDVKNTKVDLLFKFGEKSEILMLSDLFKVTKVLYLFKREDPSEAVFSFQTENRPALKSDMNEFEPPEFDDYIYKLTYAAWEIARIFGCESQIKTSLAELNEVSERIDAFYSMAVIDIRGTLKASVELNDEKLIGSRDVGIVTAVSVTFGNKKFLALCSFTGVCDIDERGFITARELRRENRIALQYGSSDVIDTLALKSKMSLLKEKFDKKEKLVLVLYPKDIFTSELDLLFM